MEQDKLKKYLLKIGDLVLDEEKIVTYKFLSRTLDIHVNTAKQLLHTFLKQQQDLTPGIISATYLLAGLLKDGSHVVSVVTEDNLNGAYLKFDIITSEHVYSVQKVKASTIEGNSEMLYIADSDIKHRKRWVIKCDESVEENSFESGSDKQCNTQSIEQTVGPNASIENEEPKTEEKCERKKNENVVVKRSPQKDKKKNSITHFFNNHSQRKNFNAEKCIEEKSADSKSLDGKRENSRNVDDIDLKKMSINEDVREETKIKEKPTNKSRNVGKRKNKGGDSKKRKRIISDSEESESDEEKRDAMLCTEAEVPQNLETLNKSDDDDDDDIFRHKKKKKKFVDKTVLRDDGYMETIKEAVYETDSESESQAKKEKKTVENEESPKLSKPQETIKRKAVASKNTSKKQQTLLSFFKKN